MLSIQQFLHKIWILIHGLRFEQYQLFSSTDHNSEFSEVFLFETGFRNIKLDNRQKNLLVSDSDHASEFPLCTPTSIT